MRLNRYSICFLIFFPLTVQPQQSGVSREVRAVWLTTLMGLDWPARELSGDRAAQMQSLREIFDRLQELNFNTVYFQVRSRGNAFYASRFEPWAGELSGVFGKDPGWDPLEFAVAEAHRRGLELHAWINVFRVWTGGSPPMSGTPRHITRTNPDWAARYKDDYWIDPGIPEAREYTASVCLDIASRYDVDGLHLDYCRYPDAAFDDAATYRAYGEKREKEQWRRDNVSDFVRTLHQRATALKPWLKIGSAPIGIYRNLPTAHGWEGYRAVSQDSRHWLREGFHDYVVPQVYWGLSSRGSRIDFLALARDWQNNSSHRHAIIGIGAYRPEVSKYIDEHIAASREAGASGQAFFRYRFIEKESAFQTSYREKAIPPAMQWKSNRACDPPIAFRVEREADGRARISWQLPPASSSDDSPFWCVIYRDNTDVHNATGRQVIAIVQANALSYLDTMKNGGSRYAISAVNRYGSESGILTEGAVSPVKPTITLAHLYNVAVADETSSADNDLSIIGYSIPRATKVRLRLTDENGGIVSVLYDDVQQPGMYLIGVQRRTERGAISGFIFETDEYRTARVFLPPSHERSRSEKD